MYYFIAGYYKRSLQNWLYDQAHPDSLEPANLPIDPFDRIID